MTFDFPFVPECEGEFIIDDCGDGWGWLGEHNRRKSKAEEAVLEGLTRQLHHNLDELYTNLYK